MSPPDHDPLEDQLRRLLRDVPPHVAPASLESRVRSAIAARSAQPWWTRGFGAWPIPARVAFLLLSAAVASFWVLPVVRDGGSLSTAADSFFRLPTAVTGLGNALLAVWNALRAAAGAIPTLWLYGLAAAIAAIYGSLVGLGAIAYRAYRINR